MSLTTKLLGMDGKRGPHSGLPLLKQAVLDSFIKLNPREQWRNPVMFVVFVGALLVTASLFRDFTAFTVQIALWLWFTVLFANFAEALAEGRGKAHANALRSTRTKTLARKMEHGKTREVPATDLRRGDIVVCETGDIIPADGEVIEGIATVDESAITGESAPVIRESGGDRNAVTGGTRVISDRIVVRVQAEPGHSFLDRMIALIENARRQKTPNEIALGIVLVTLTLLFIVAVITLPAFGWYSEQAAGQPGIARLTLPILVSLIVCLIPTTIGGLLSAIGIGGIGRLMRHNVLAMSGRAVEAAGDIDVLLLDKTGTITLGNRVAVAFLPAPGIQEKELADAAQLASLADETPEGRSIVVLAKAAPRFAGPGSGRAESAIHSVHGADPDEWRGFDGGRRACGAKHPQGRGGGHATSCRAERRCLPGVGGLRRRTNRTYGRHPAGGGRSVARSGRHPFERRGQGQHPRALCASSQNGHPHRDDHGG